MKTLLKALLITFFLIILSSTPADSQDGNPLPLSALTNQDIRFSHLTIDDGLSNDRVFAVAQDQAGFLWIGTTDGLNRYDGYDFQIYKSDDEDPNSLSDSYVRVLWVDKGGHIWIGTDLGGVNRFDPVTQTFSYYQHDPDDPNSLISGKIFALFEDSSGLIWVSTENGLNSIEPASGEIRHYLHNPDDPNSISSNLIRYVYEDKNGEIWVATFGGGLNLFDRQAGTFTHYRHDPDDPNSLCDDQTWTIMEDSFGVYWIGTLTGLYAWNPETGSGTCYKNDPGDPGSVGNDFAKAIYEDSTGALWIGTWGGGLNLFNRDSGEFIRYQHDPLNPSSLANDRITAIYEDEGGILWVGTVDGGLDKFDRSQQRFIRLQHEPDNPNSLDNNIVTALVEAGNGDIWIGTDTSVNMYNRSRGQFVHFRHDPLDPTTIEVSQRVHAIIKDHEGVVWVGTAGGGLNRFDPTTGGFHTYRPDPEDPHSLSSDQVHSIFEDSAGVLWVGMLRGGLAQFNPQTETVEAAYRHDPQDPHSLSDDTIDVIYEDQAGRLWLGTPSGGLNWFDREKEQFGVIRHDPDNLESLSSDKINSIYQDSRGVLWVGTPMGLNRIVITGNDLSSDVTITRYTEKDGLPNNVIQSILEDDRGYLWLGTNRGISRFDPQTEIFKNFTAADGLSGDEFQGKAAIRLNSGELLFGSSAGLTLFTPDKISDSPYLPPIKITNFKLLNKSVGLGDASPLRNSIWETDQLSLSHQDDVITFEFAALSYAHPAGNQYQYMLEGFDDDWSPVSDQHSATYTNLDPGQYVFRVRGSNSSGVWNEAGTSIRLIIAPPWWQTWWFTGGTLLLLIGLVAGGFVWQRQSAKRRQRHLEAQVLERTRALSFAEEQIRTLFESSQVGIALTTPEGRILAFNRALLHITGYSETEVLQHNVIDLYADPESRIELLAQLSTKTVENFGVALKRKDGSPVSVSMNVSRIRRDGQEILLALVEDVTEHIQLTERLQEEITIRKQAEQELQAQISLVDSLLDVALETVEIFDANTFEYIKWNKTFSQLIGYSDDEIVAMHPVDDFVYEADLEKAEAGFELLFRDGHAVETVRIVKKDGSLIPIEYTVGLTRDPASKPLFIIGIGRDISERMRVEERLRFQARLLESVGQAVIVTDLGGHIVYWNESAERLYGWSAEEAIGRKSSELLVNKASQQQPAEMMACMQAGQSWSGEYQAHRRDGTYLPIETTLAPFTNGAGELTHIIGVSADITERKQAEESLQASRQFVQASLDALSAHIAILDERGTIIGLNAAWRKFAQDNHMTWPDYGLGRNYLATFDPVTGEAIDDSAQQAAVGLRAMLAGERDYFQLAYHCHSPTKQRWFVMHVTRFEMGNDRRVVIAHQDITDRKRSERELQTRVGQLETLNLIGQTLSTVIGLREKVEIVAATMTHLFDATQVSINLLNSDRSEITVFAYFDRRAPVASLVGKSEAGPNSGGAELEGMVFQIRDDPIARQLFQEKTAVVIAQPQNNPYLVPNRELLQAQQVQSLMLVPMVSQDTVLGVVAVATDQSGREFRPDEVTLAETIAGQIAGAIELARLFEQAQQLAVTEERNRLARELHDSVTQALYSINLFANAAQLALSGGKVAVATEHIRALRKLVDEGMRDMRLLIFELRPPILEEVGLEAALKARLDAVESRSGIAVQFVVEGQNNLSTDKQAELYRVGQEALTNVVKHAETKQLTVHLKFGQNHVRLEIQDDGIGFDLEQTQLSGKLGLQSMRERVLQIGGTLNIDSGPGRGTLVWVEV